jgi:hypothetical protein
MCIYFLCLVSESIVLCASKLTQTSELNQAANWPLSSNRITCHAWIPAKRFANWLTGIIFWHTTCSLQGIRSSIWQSATQANVRTHGASGLVRKERHLPQNSWKKHHEIEGNKAFKISNKHLKSEAAGAVGGSDCAASFKKQSGLSMDAWRLEDVQIGCGKDDKLVKSCARGDKNNRASDYGQKICFTLVSTPCPPFLRLAPLFLT